jgi:ribosomal protein S18 acetylase RimI-like enzyme
MTPAGVLLRVASVADLDLVEPLWIAVHQRHAETMPELAPYVDGRESWRVRRALYEELLRKPNALLILATVGDEVVGYGLAHLLDAKGSWIADTWTTGPQVGEIESLSVLPKYRGSGLGSRILKRLENHLRDHGVDDLILGVLPGNRDAMRLYMRRGYRPTFLYLSRFRGR